MTKSVLIQAILDLKQKRAQLLNENSFIRTPAVCEKERQILHEIEILQNCLKREE